MPLSAATLTGCCFLAIPGTGLGPLRWNELLRNVHSPFSRKPPSGPQPAGMCLCLDTHSPVGLSTSCSTVGLSFWKLLPSHPCSSPRHSHSCLTSSTTFPQPATHSPPDSGCAIRPSHAACCWLRSPNTESLCFSELPAPCLLLSGKMDWLHLRPFYLQLRSIKNQKWPLEAQNDTCLLAMRVGPSVPCRGKFL